MRLWGWPGAMAGLGAAAVLLCAARARAGNDDEVLVGNDAALAAGAVTATTADGTAIYYNPAGVAAPDVNTVDASASAFVLRIYDVPRFLSATTGAEDGTHLSELVSIPSALSYVRPLHGDFRIGAGIFVTRANDVTLRASNLYRAGANTENWRVNLADKASIYHVGASAAWEPVPTLRIGISAFGIYATRFGYFDLSGGIYEGFSTIAFAGYATRFSVQAFGFRFGAGVQWEPAPWLRIGASVQTPAWIFATRVSGDTTVSGSAPEIPGTGRLYSPTDTEDTVFQVEEVVPARFRVGVAWWHERGYLAIDGDIQTALSNTTAQIERDLVWNLRLGGQVGLSDRVGLGAGVFTDRSPAPDPAGFAQSQVDFYGFTLGLQYGRAYRFHEEEEREGIRFSSTLALRYSHGRGHIGSLVTRPYGTAENLFEDRTVGITVNEIGVHIGSSLRF